MGWAFVTLNKKVGVNRAVLSDRFSNLETMSCFDVRIYLVTRARSFCYCWFRGFRVE